MKIICDGKFTIPLFHGTSSLFVDSILKHGLGARNPVEEMRVLPFLKHAYELCEQLFASDVETPWNTWKFVVKAMIDQKITNGGFNFRHGETYLTSSRDAAVRYAVTNPLGSEVLSMAARLYRMIKEHDQKRLSDPEFKESPVLQVLDKEARLILVEVFDVNIHDLEGEAGKNLRQIIDTMEVSEGKDVKNFEISQCNFKLNKSIAADQLRLYEIVLIKRDQIFPKYELRALEITH